LRSELLLNCSLARFDKRVILTDADDLDYPGKYAVKVWYSNGCTMDCRRLATDARRLKRTHVPIVCAKEEDIVYQLAGSRFDTQLNRA